MITGEQIREARKRAGWSQKALADKVGVVERTVGGWERGENAPGMKEPQLLAVLRDYLDTESEPPLRSVSDVELLAEIARRFARSEQREAGERGGDTPATKDPDSRPELRVAARDIGERSAGQKRRDLLKGAGEEDQGEGPEGGA